MIRMIDFTQQKAEIAERLNRVRLARAKALFSPLQRHLFTLIPYLVHHHHQSLPGYNGESTPCGVKNFAPGPHHFEALDIFKLEAVDAEPPEVPCLDGVYAMGSTASFGQHPKSDVDIWLVYGGELDNAGIGRLQQKSRMLTNWFAGYGFEVNFYLVHQTQFSRDYQSRIHNEWEILGHEHSGSAQHWLLLEEFYRSHIRLAGKPVAWWPGAQAEAGYLFFGDVHKLPANEYFGASLWQLYKGLDKPHKALLKVLLLEAYASDYPRSQLITDAIWQKALAGDFSIDNDPYLLLYDVIDVYLTRVGDTRRLEIARRCLYLKCGIRLTDQQQPQDWRYQQLRKMVLDWEWPYSLVATLDNCDHWHSGELQWFNAQLNELMLVSYQTLLRFASTHSLSEHFKIEDLGLLTRKLHTYFSENEQQILRLNPLWSQSLAEKHLTIVRSSQSQKQSYLYRLPPEPRQFFGEVAIYKAVDTASLIAWACLNGICDKHTRWHEYGRSNSRGRRLRRVALRLLPHLENRHWRVSKMDLCQPWHYRKVLLLLNLDYDPTVDWPGQGLMLDILGSNLLSVGQQQVCLLGSIHLISFNSWGEWHCHSFQGEQALLQLISYVAPGLKRGGEKVELDVVSASKKVQPQLEHGIRRLLKQIYRLIRDARDSRTLVQPLQLREKRYGLFFDARGVSYRDLSDVKSLYRQMARGELQQPPQNELSSKRQITVPQVIRDFAVKGILQYFLQQRDGVLDVFVMDERNQLSYYLQAGADVSELVAQLTRHYAFGDIQNLRDRFNFPQFFMLVTEENKTSAIPFGFASGTGQSEF
ncbi:class I adenylate cyclase [Shewanella sp. A32]|uniref:class I adenylate cyclase n=1 Tax=Shewanella sp. A32 TaxID=3031327 RepID=UPI0023B96496|nr:class I adenylate cyclase [Shewanella sp. A32]MDF0534986.1 class I adenylate cyclase [Shewanella sp. A32]